MSNTGSTDNFGYGQELKRELSFKDVFVYGMLFMVVIAPMSIYGYISKDSHLLCGHLRHVLHGPELHEDE